MADDLADFWVHDVTVERRTSTGSSGTTYAAPVVVRGFVESGPRMVRNATGAEVVASTTVYLPPGTAYIPPGSYVTPPAAFGAGRSKVIACAVHDGGGLPTPDHLEVMAE